MTRNVQDEGDRSKQQERRTGGIQGSESSEERPPGAANWDCFIWEERLDMND